jgi:hypothetical protein
MTSESVDADTLTTALLHQRFHRSSHTLRTCTSFASCLSSLLNTINIIPRALASTLRSGNQCKDSFTNHHLATSILSQQSRGPAASTNSTKRRAAARWSKGKQSWCPMFSRPTTRTY